MFSTDKFDELPIGEKLKIVKKIRGMYVMNSVRKDDLQHVFNWFVDYTQAATDLFEVEELEE